MMSILDQVERFLAASGMAPTTFGEQAASQRNLVPRLRAGRDVTTRTATRITEFISSHSENETDPRPRGDEVSAGPS